MNIPESVILPFEPLGIPRIGILPYASVIEALDEAFKTMNELGDGNEKPMHLEGIELFLKGCLQSMDALMSKVHITQFCYNECDISVYYMTKRTRNLERYNCTVHSNGGFTNSGWLDE